MSALAVLPYVWAFATTSEPASEPDPIQPVQPPKPNFAFYSE